MNIDALAGSMSLTATAGQITTSVMKDAQNLEKDLVARLFGSIGIGNGIDAHA